MDSLIGARSRKCRGSELKRPLENQIKGFAQGNDNDGNDYALCTSSCGDGQGTTVESTQESRTGEMIEMSQNKREPKRKPHIYYRLMEKKRETDAKVEAMRRQKYEEEKKLRQRRHKSDDSKSGFYERMMEAQRKRDARIEEMRQAQTKKYSFTPTIPASPYCKKRSPGHESIFDRLYRTSTASSSAYTTATDTNSSHRSSNASSSTQMSARLVALYQDGQRRAKHRPKSQTEEEQRRENHLLKQKDYTFKPQVVWNDELVLTHRRQNDRIGILPRLTPTPTPVDDNAKRMGDTQSPPREIVIGTAAHICLPAPPLNPRTSSYIVEAQKAEPWTTPPRPTRVVFPRRPPSILDYDRLSHVAPTDFAVVSPLRDSASFLRRSAKETYATRYLSRGIYEDVCDSDGHTTEDENSAAYDSEGVISDLKTEYGSI